MVYGTLKKIAAQIQKNKNKAKLLEMKINKIMILTNILRNTPFYLIKCLFVK